MPDIRLDDTIAAIATPIGEGGISVIRVSGPETFSVVSKIFHPLKKGSIHDFSSHTLHLGEIRNDKNEILDQVMVGLFRAPHSYTGEDVIEISCHGGLVVSRNILNLIIQHGARHAEPGEFTKRAFLNGKIDLTQAEAVLDLIKAKSQNALEIATRQLSGSLSRKLKALKEELMKLYAHIEVYLDLPDEHFEIYSDDRMKQTLNHVRHDIDQLVASFARGSLLREGFVVVIAGKPNVGKSSLFNALLERDRALVSEFPGTTRDWLEESLEIDGAYLRLVDTAGLAPTADHPLDYIGMDRTKQALEEAHLYLYMVDNSTLLEEADRLTYQALKKNKPVIVLLNKSDLPAQFSFSDLKKITSSDHLLKISTKTREGFEALEKKIAEIVKDSRVPNEGEQITRLRHKNALQSAAQFLHAAEKSLAKQESLEIVALDLKSALDSLRELIGEIYSEDLLDVIFAEFCIGK